MRHEWVQGRVVRAQRRRLTVPLGEFARRISTPIATGIDNTLMHPIPATAHHFEPLPALSAPSVYVLHRVQWHLRHRVIDTATTSRCMYSLK